MVKKAQIVDRADSTLTLYDNNYTRIISNLGVRFSVNMLKQYMLGLAFNTRLSYVQSIVITRKLKAGPIFDYFLELRDESEFNFKPFTDKELALNFKWSEIVELQKTLVYGTFRHLLISLYTFVPPLRSGEYCDMKTVRTNKYNYVDLVNSNFVIIKGKTSKKYKIRMVPIPPNLVLILENWISHNPNENEWLFGKHYKSSYITQVLNSAFGDRSIAVDLLRKTYITEFAPHMTIKDRTELAYNMGHSLLTQMAVYDKTINSSTMLTPTNY